MAARLVDIDFTLTYRRLNGDYNELLFLPGAGWNKSLKTQEFVATGQCDGCLLPESKGKGRKCGEQLLLCSPLSRSSTTAWASNQLILIGNVNCADISGRLLKK